MSTSLSPIHSSATEKGPQVISAIECYNLKKKQKKTVSRFLCKSDKPI